MTLEQTPLVEGALVAIDNRTGHIKAMVGGWNFNRSKFNRAVQAYPADRLDLQADRLHDGDRPRIHAGLDDHRRPRSATRADNGQIYAPQNYDHKFEGAITLRRALEDSRNIPAVKMMETLGPAKVLGYAKRFGFERGRSRRIWRSRSAPATPRCSK